MKLIASIIYCGPFAENKVLFLNPSWIVRRSRATEAPEIPLFQKI